jgi:hypothetical protein
MYLNIDSWQLILFGIIVLGSFHGFISGILIGGFQTKKFIASGIAAFTTLFLNTLFFGFVTDTPKHLTETLIGYSLTIIGSAISGFLSSHILKTYSK